MFWMSKMQAIKRSKCVGFFNWLQDIWISINRTEVCKNVLYSAFAEGRMGYWLRGHERERNNCFSKIQLVGQKYWDKTTLASKTRFSRHCFSLLHTESSRNAKSRYSIFSLICPFQDPLTISTTHWMLLIPLCQTKPSTFEMIFPSHPDIALDQFVSPQCWRLVLLIQVLKISKIKPMSRDKSSKTALWLLFHIPPSQPLTFW